MEVRGEEEPLREAIEQVEGVTKVEIEVIEGSDHLKTIVESEPGTDLRGKLAAAAVGKGLELFELKAVSLSLEDIFLQLTTEEASSAQEAKAAV